jgi:hypothetical protein
MGYPAAFSLLGKQVREKRTVPKEINEFHSDQAHAPISFVRF